jgi:hypothetical protein
MLLDLSSAAASADHDPAGAESINEPLKSV